MLHGRLSWRVQKFHSQLNGTPTTHLHMKYVLSAPLSPCRHTLSGTVCSITYKLRKFTSQQSLFLLEVIQRLTFWLGAVGAISQLQQHSEDYQVLKLTRIKSNNMHTVLEDSWPCSRVALHTTSATGFWKLPVLDVLSCSSYFVPRSRLCLVTMATWEGQAQHRNGLRGMNTGFPLVRTYIFSVCILTEAWAVTMQDTLPFFKNLLSIR